MEVIFALLYLWLFFRASAWVIQRIWGVVTWLFRDDTSRAESEPPLPSRAADRQFRADARISNFVHDDGDETEVIRIRWAGDLDLPQRSGLLAFTVQLSTFADGEAHPVLSHAAWLTDGESAAVHYSTEAQPARGAVSFEFDGTSIHIPTAVLVPARSGHREVTVRLWATLNGQPFDRGDCHCKLDCCLLSSIPIFARFEVAALQKFD